MRLERKLHTLLTGIILRHLLRSWRTPLRFWTTIKILKLIGRAFNRRKTIRDISIPPYLIASVTTACNLSCKGCYAHAHQRKTAMMSVERWRSLFDECADLGIAAVFVAGGEPLLRKDILEEIAHHPRTLFPVITNGTLIDDDMIKFFKSHRHIIPIISIEGHESHTDERRGFGVGKQTTDVFKKLKNNGIITCVSLTVTRENTHTVMAADYMNNLARQGISVAFLVEYVPIAPNTDHLILTDDEKLFMNTQAAVLTKHTAVIAIPFPGDEAEFDGCLASGRSFLHIAPDGSAEPCPFAPFSDMSLTAHTLKEILASPMLAQIREKHALLKETQGGCALWANRDELKTMLTDKGATE